MKTNSLSVNKIIVSSFGLKLFLTNNDGQEIARTFLYIMHNNLHKQSFALLEDVFVKEEERNKGHASRLIKQAIAEAKKLNCYKIIATSRHQRTVIHQLYLNLGFKDWGQEFRLDF
jgi:GNAT superfamily N-acetyltransferase